VAAALVVQRAEPAETIELGLEEGAADTASCLQISTVAVR
jgi:hypothetical protein